MKTITTIILLFGIIWCNGQTCYLLSKNIADFIRTDCTNDTVLFWINNIIRFRDHQYLEQKLKGTHCSKIKMTEVWDKKWNTYGIKEEYGIDILVKNTWRDNVEDTIYYDHKWNYISFFPQLDTLKDQVLSFGPNTIAAFCGCGQVSKKIRRECSKKARYLVRKDGIVAETFSRLITYIDLDKQKVRFILEIPVSGKRKLYYGFGFLDPANRNWYE